MFINSVTLFLSQSTHLHKINSLDDLFSKRKCMQCSGLGLLKLVAVELINDLLLGVLIIKSVMKIFVNSKPYSNLLIFFTKSTAMTYSQNWNVWNSYIYLNWVQILKSSAFNAVKWMWIFNSISGVLSFVKATRFVDLMVTHEWNSHL